METQNVVNLRTRMSFENEYSKFATKRWHVIHSKTRGSNSHLDPIIFLSGSLKSSLCNYSDVYILVAGDIAVKRRNDADTTDIELAAAIQVSFKNCAPFKDCGTEMNDTFANYADFINT